MSIRVLLVDDHKIMRNGLSAILKAEDDIEIVANTGTGEEAIMLALKHSPDVVIMDLSLPDMGGMEATRKILSQLPHVNILILSMLLDQDCVFDSLESGARGYLVKDCAAEELVAAIRKIHGGKPYFCAEVQEVMIQRVTLDNSKDKASVSLTPREREVLVLTAQGFSIKEIAFELNISDKMVEVHRAKLKKKLGLGSIAQLTVYAVRTGLISV
jgi:DNA-binding NarL/FixJ family response regulator